MERFVRMKWAVTLMASTLLLLPAAAPAASGSVFYGGWYDEAIGSVEFDGSNSRPDLIINESTIPEAMTVGGGYLYWESNSFPIGIGRSHIDGSEVDPNFIVGGPGQAGAVGVSISNNRLYWSETRNSTGLGPAYLSSANLDGSGRTPRTLSLGRNAGGPVVVVGRSAFYLIQKDVRGVERYSIARKRLDGKGSRRLLAANRPYVDESLTTLGSHIYWLERGRNSLFLARATLNAASINTRFRRIPRKGCAADIEGTSVQAAAISSTSLFLVCSSGQIDRVSMSGHAHLRVLETGASLSSGPVLAVTP